MRKYFLASLVPLYVSVWLIGKYFGVGYYALYVFIIPITILGLKDIFQTKHIILRNYPVLGHFRFLLESIRPEIQQYFIERFDDGAPFSREQRSIVYQRAKGELDSSAFGTQHNVYATGAEWLEHSLQVTDKLKENDERIKIGNHQCQKPYSASRMNISAMSYGSLSKTAIESLNMGAKIGGFYHNTGEGGISSYHQKNGGDLCWQVGTGYFGCRNPDGSFNADMFAEKSKMEQVKLIELKLSQGAKPGHGGILPAAKVSAEIAKIRAVEMGKDVLSPPLHSAFTGPKGLIQFIAKLRELSEGKPVGFKLCIGKKSEFFAICKAMIELDIYPDFITIDGSEGGTGASPREFTNFLGTPLNDGLNFVHNALLATGLRDKIIIIASGKIVDAFDMVTKFSLGADICNSARGMLFALGCIQALRCNSNNCPTGIATQDPSLYKLIDITNKSQRVARFHKKTLHELVDLLQAAGVDEIRSLKKKHIKRRIGPGEITNYEKLFPKLSFNSLIDKTYDGPWLDDWNEAESSKF